MSGSPEIWSIGADGSSTTVLTRNEKVAEELKHLITTMPGECPVDLTYGCGARMYVQRPLDKMTEDLMGIAIVTAVAQFMSYVTIKAVQFQRDVQSGSLLCSIKYSIPGEEESSTTVLL